MQKTAWVLKPTDAPASGGRYQIGDVVKDEDGGRGIVVIQWDDGDICVIENDAAHPNPVIVGQLVRQRTGIEPANVS